MDGERQRKIEMLRAKGAGLETPREGHRKRGRKIDREREHGERGRTRAGAFQLLSRNAERFQGGLVFKAHRLLYHSTVGLREIKRRERGGIPGARPGTGSGTCLRVQIFQGLGL